MAAYKPSSHTEPRAAAWLKSLLEQSESARLGHLDLLVNTSRLDYSLPEHLQALAVPPQLAPLLEHTPEVAIADKGPLLVRIDLAVNDQRAWLAECLTQMYSQRRILVIHSRWPFAVLTKHLRCCTQAEWNQGNTTGLLRYFDPRLFLATCEMLDAAQSRGFHAPALSWHWIDRDDKPARLDGYAVPPQDAKPLVLRLSNAQVATLMAWTNAEMFRQNYALEPAQYGQLNREGLMRHLMHAQLAADRGSCFDDSREVFIHNWLVRHSATAPDLSELQG
ncbi:DUF4123 domain-containing protein [Halopseudomonas sp.]|uniref:DUF4123 domain-containing protein n=1 Tax=Halopseudomonas sp. TaxID=2901191 RepID=UPI003001F493